MKSRFKSSSKSGIGITSVPLSVLTSLRKAGTLIATTAACFTIASVAKAQLSLVYETGPNAGKAYTGSFNIKLLGVDMGTLYNLPAGTAAGFGQNTAAGSTATNVNDGITLLDGKGSPPATGSIGSEDSWGIARVTSITANDAFESVVWSPSGKGQELTIFFYGEKDYYISQTGAETFVANGVGLHADFYIQSTSSPSYTPYDVSLGAAGRTGVNSYTNVTDGTMVLSTVSTAGFLNGAGVDGGPLAEFASTFDSHALSGQGTTYLSVTGGTDASKFDTNSFVSAISTADFKAEFTTKPPTGAAASAGWLVAVNDPIAGLIVTPIPEPATYGVLGAAALLGLITVRRRFLKVV